MSDNFMDLLSGEGAGPQKPEEQGMGDLLGGLLGGGEGGLGDLLGGLLGGGATNAPGGDTGGMAEVLGGLMGSQEGGQESPGGLGDLLGGSGGLGSLLGGLLGGGAGQMTFGGGGGASLPFAGALAEKLGISEQMANMLIMGAIGLLTSSLAKQRSSGRSAQVDYNSLADPDYIRSTGIAGRLSGQMGVSEEQAIRDLQQTMNLLAAGGPAATQPVKPAPAKKPASGKKKASSAKPKSEKKPSKKNAAPDFMDLLDDPNG